MEPTVQSFGETLPDQVERIASLFDAHLELIGDVRELYTSRAALEREYATKLQLLTKKAADKKSKMEALIVVGSDPTKSWDTNTLRQNSLNAAYDAIMNSMTSTAQDHVNIADALASQVVEVLKGLEKKSEDAKKKEIQFFQKLLGDRDRVYAERLKSKQKYDEDCVEADSYRQKGRAQDDRHADRAARQAEQQRNDMLSSKNVYIISTAIANKSKAQFYEINLPELENQFQSLQHRLVERFAKLLRHTQTLQLSHLDVLKSRINGVELALEKVDPARDQGIFIEHNIRPFTLPNDWVFEPCATFYDTSEMSVELAPKIFLQNKLSRCRSKLQELKPYIDEKKRDATQLSKQILAYRPDHTLGEIDDVSDSYLEANHQLMLYETSERILDTEIEIIVAAVGGDEGSLQPHSFKSSSFSIPTHCEYCKTSIWGLSKQGKTCKLCGISVHSKCELKVPANCGESEGGHRPSILSRHGKSLSRTASQVVPEAQMPTASSFMQSTASEESHEEVYPSALVLFDFTPTSEFELGISEGAIVRVKEPDDGSGWAKVVDTHGRDGLVPASYLDSNGPVSSQPSATQQGPGQYVRAIYPYVAQGADELGFQEGETIELTSGPTGGRNFGDGWWEGEKDLSFVSSTVAPITSL
ncbi:hypothetical protein BDZ94DRAFT_1296252 [Collybia nuda]|uniref:Protein BZZ1 n=1 Tax=Collybia nuda TaxID=64659 RepID=A0A9P5Y8Y4_9AGAR|nr:hypothetical protein BDZ94DRAFT_1296252 [Collybia nuda]